MNEITVCTINNLSLKLQSGVHLLKTISYKIKKNDFIVILGSNGSGKTTLLKTISGAVGNYSGHVKILNKFEPKKSPPSTLSKHVGTITQNVGDSLFMEFSLAQNFQIYEDANGKKGGVEGFLNILKTINPKLTTLMGAKTSTLSGGERQSFLLGLNLFFKKDLLLLDEHTSALDPKTAQDVMEITAEKLQENKITCIMTTHSLDDAIKYGNRLVAMKNGQIIKTFDGEAKQSLSKVDLLNYCY